MTWLILADPNALYKIYREPVFFSDDSAFSVTAAVSGMTGSVCVQRTGWWVQWLPARHRGEGFITRLPVSTYLSWREAPDLT